MLWRIVRVEVKIFVNLCGFPINGNFDCSIGILVVFVSRNAIDPFSSCSTVNLMYWLMEFRWVWNSASYSRERQTWLSSRYLYHHFGGGTWYLMHFLRRTPLPNLQGRPSLANPWGTQGSVYKMHHRRWNRCYKAPIGAVLRWTRRTDWFSQGWSDHIQMCFSRLSVPDL